MLPEGGGQLPISRPDWWKGRFAFFRISAGTREGRCLSKGQLSALKINCARAFLTRVGGWGGLHAETAQSALTVIFRLIIGGLTSLILIVQLILQFQGQFVSMSLRPVLGTVAAYVAGAA